MRVQGPHRQNFRQDQTPLLWIANTSEHVGRCFLSFWIENNAATDGPWVDKVRRISAQADAAAACTRSVASSRSPPSCPGPPSTSSRLRGRSAPHQHQRLLVAGLAMSTTAFALVGFFAQIFLFSVFPLKLQGPQSLANIVITPKIH